LENKLRPRTIEAIKCKILAGTEATKQTKRALLDDEEDMTSREGSFKHGGLVRSGKPKLAKKGWR